MPENLEEPRTEPKASTGLGPATSTGRPLRVLIVEDDLSSCLLLQGLVSKYGECYIAPNGVEAIKEFRAARDAGKSFDLICMDIQMPEMDGQEAVTQIRAIELREGTHATGAKILMTTSSRDVRTILASYGARCDGYLIKPFDGAQLEERLKSLGLVK